MCGPARRQARNPWVSGLSGGRVFNIASRPLASAPDPAPRRSVNVRFTFLGARERATGPTGLPRKAVGSGGVARSRPAGRPRWAPPRRRRVAFVDRYQAWVKSAKSKWNLCAISASPQSRDGGGGHGRWTPTAPTGATLWGRGHPLWPGGAAAVAGQLTREGQHQLTAADPDPPAAATIPPPLVNDHKPRCRQRGGRGAECGAPLHRG